MITSSDLLPLYCQNTFYKQFISVYTSIIHIYKISGNTQALGHNPVSHPSPMVLISLPFIFTFCIVMLSHCVLLSLPTLFPNCPKKYFADKCNTMCYKLFVTKVSTEIRYSRSNSTNKF